MRLRYRAQMSWDRDNATVSRYPAFYNPSLIMTSHRDRYQAILHSAARAHSGTDPLHPLRHRTPGHNYHFWSYLNAVIANFALIITKRAYQMNGICSCP